MRTRSLRFQFINDVAALLRQQGAEVTHQAKCRTLIVNGHIRVSSHLIWRRSRAQFPAASWRVRKIEMANPVDLVLVVRMNSDGTARDFFLVPAGDFDEFPRWLGEQVPEEARAFQPAEGTALVARMLSPFPAPGSRAS